MSILLNSLSVLEQSFCLSLLHISNLIKAAIINQIIISSLIFKSILQWWQLLMQQGMKQKCQIQMSVTQYKNADTPLRTKGINTIYQHFQILNL